MIIFVENDKFFIGAYFDELELKARENKQYEPKHFRYPTEALQFLKKKHDKIHLIVFDLMMGTDDASTEKVGGVDFFEKLNANESFKGIPIIILSIHDRESYKYIHHRRYDNPSITIIDRNQHNRTEVFWRTVEEAISVKGGKR